MKLFATLILLASFNVMAAEPARVGENTSLKCEDTPGTACYAKKNAHLNQDSINADRTVKPKDAKSKSAKGSDR